MWWLWEAPLATPVYWAREAARGEATWRPQWRLQSPNTTRDLGNDFQVPDTPKGDTNETAGRCQGPKIIFGLFCFFWLPKSVVLGTINYQLYVPELFNIQQQKNLKKRVRETKKQ